jgi:heme-degrading monooxygenase HmoA
LAVQLLTLKEEKGAMFARVLKMRLRVDKIAEATRIFRGTVIPLCRKQPGFRGGYYMSDPKTGESIALTFWERKDDMLATEASRFFQEQVARFVPFFAKPPIREAFEVEVIAGEGPQNLNIPKD